MNIAEGDVAHHGRGRVTFGCWSLLCRCSVRPIARRAWTDTEIDRAGYILHHQVGEGHVFKACSESGVGLNWASGRRVEQAVGDGDVFRVAPAKTEDRPARAEVRIGDGDVLAR